MTDHARKRASISLLGYKCQIISCGCEGTKAFAEYPLELYCSDCFDRIKELRLKRVVSA